MLCDRSKFHRGVADKHVFLVMTRCQPASGLGAQTSAVFCPRTTVKTVMTGAALAVKAFCYKQVVAGLPKVLAEREHRGEDEERDVPSASCEFGAKPSPAPFSVCSSCRFLGLSCYRNACVYLAKYIKEGFRADHVIVT